MRKPQAIMAGLAVPAIALLIFAFIFGMSWTRAIILTVVLALVALFLATNNKLRAILSIPELRQKIFITLLFLTIYRIGFYVPLPFVDQVKLNESLSQQSSTLGKVLGFVSQFSGGNLSNQCIFALGIMPYI